MQARQSARPAKLSRRARQQRAQSASAASNEAESDKMTEDDTEVPQRLDPLLFAAAFAQSGDAAARQVLRGERVDAPARRASLARGLDGQPMTHVRGERTIVRALNESDSPSLEGEADAPFLYSALGVQRPRATARERAYKKRKLGLRAQDIRASTLEAPRAPKKRTRAASDPNDPLGLHDPALAPGGEWFRAGTARRRHSNARPAAALRDRGAGGRVRGTYALLTAVPMAQGMGPAAHFARGRLP